MPPFFVCVALLGFFEAAASPRPPDHHSRPILQGGQRLSFIDFNVVVPLSAQFCLGS